MKKDIYNKNAREAYLMAEAYDNIYKEGSFYGRDDLADKLKKEREDSGAVTLELRDSAGTQRATLPKGDPKIDELLAKGYTKVEDNEDVKSNIKFSVGGVGGYHSQTTHIEKTFDSLEAACKHAGVDIRDCIAGEWDDMGDGTKEYVVDEDTAIVMHAASEDNEEAQAYRDMSDRYKAEDSIEVGNVYKGESYHELVIGIKGDEVFTKKITLEDGNRYDKKQMLDEVKLAGKIEHDFLNEIM